MLLFHLPEDGIGIGKGVAHTGGAEIDGDYGAATFRQQFEAGATGTQWHPAIGAGGKNGITTTDAANMVHTDLLVRETIIGIYGGILKTGTAESLGIHMTASVTPKVKGPALRTQDDPAAIAVYHRGQCAAEPAGGGIICYNLHEEGN